MSATEFRTYELNCDHPECRRYIQSTGAETRAALRKRVAKDGWTHVHREGYMRSSDKDFCPHHNPDLTVRVRAALEDGGWAEFSIRTEGGKVMLDAPGDPCSWRTLVTGQCAGYLNKAGFTAEINGDSIELTPEAGQ